MNSILSRACLLVLPVCAQLLAACSGPDSTSTSEARVEENTNLYSREIFPDDLTIAGGRLFFSAWHAAPFDYHELYSIGLNGKDRRRIASFGNAATPRMIESITATEDALFVASTEHKPLFPADPTPTNASITRFDLATNGSSTAYEPKTLFKDALNISVTTLASSGALLYAGHSTGDLAVIDTRSGGKATLFASGYTNAEDRSVGHIAIGATKLFWTTVERVPGEAGASDWLLRIYGAPLQGGAPRKLAEFPSDLSYKQLIVADGDSLYVATPHGESTNELKEGAIYRIEGTTVAKFLDHASVNGMALDPLGLVFWGKYGGLEYVPRKDFDAPEYGRSGYIVAAENLSFPSIAMTSKAFYAANGMKDGWVFSYPRPKPGAE